MCAVVSTLYCPPHSVGDQWGKYSGKKYKDFRKWWEREKQKDGSLGDLETEEDRDDAYEDYKADQEERSQQEDANRDEEWP